MPPFATPARRDFPLSPQGTGDGLIYLQDTAKRRGAETRRMTRGMETPFFPSPRLRVSAFGPKLISAAARARP